MAMEITRSPPSVAPGAKRKREVELPCHHIPRRLAPSFALLSDFRLFIVEYSSTVPQNPSVIVDTNFLPLALM